LKPYENLSSRGKLRRKRRAAQKALEGFGVRDAEIRLMVDAGNTTYRVKTRNIDAIDSDLFVDDCFALRLHQPGYQKKDSINSELEWISALHHEGLPVPEPIPSVNGELSIDVQVTGLPEPRQCTLLRWVKGRMVKKNVRPWHMREIGRLIGRFHDFAANWKPPRGFKRRHYDRNGLWGDDTGTGLKAGEVIPKIPQRCVPAFKDVTSRVEQVMDEWGKGTDVYGLIHADLGTEANVVFRGGEARAIDFDDSGYGYWVYDLAVPMVDWQGEPEYDDFRESLLEGYSEVRSIPDYQLERFDLFQAAFNAIEIFWGTAVTLHNPDSVYWIERRENAWRQLLNYLK
jgi:Ser/Thr protein kinase RdoA (MazF antagonist)